MELYFSDLLTTDQSELITAALAIARKAALQSQSKAAKDFLTADRHAVREDEIFQQIDIRCGELRAARILAHVRGQNRGERVSYSVGEM